MPLRELVNEVGFRFDARGLRIADRETDRFEREFIRSFERMGLRAETSFGHIGEASRGLNTDLNRTEGEISDLGASALEVEKDFDRAARGIERNLKDVGREAERATNNFDFESLAGAGGLAYTANTIEGVTAGTAHLRAQLGLTNEQAKEYEDITKRIYKDNLSESMYDAANGVALVHRGLQLTGKELEEQTKNAFKLRDVENVDVIESVDAARAMRAAFGTDVQKNYELMTYGLSSSANAADDLMDTLREYPGHFAQIGLTADDMLNFLNLGMENGARNTDYLADAIKEFGIRIKTDGDTAQLAVKRLFPADEAQRLINDFGRGGKAGREAFYTVMQELNKVDDPIKRYTTGVDLLGTKFEDLTDTQMSALIRGLAETKDETIYTDGATARLDEQYKTLNNTLEGFKRTFETSVLGSLGGFGEAVPGAIQVGANLGMMILGLKGLGIDLSGAFGKAKTTVQGFGKAVGGALAPIKNLLPWLGRLAGYAGVIAYASKVFPALMSGDPTEKMGGLGIDSGGLGAQAPQKTSPPAAHYTHMAEGGEVAKPGLSWVGERGPELLNLPESATVTPLNKLPANGGELPPIIFSVYVQGDGDASKIKNVLKREIPSMLEQYFRILQQKRPATVEY